MKLHLPDRLINSFTVIYRDDTVQRHNYTHLLDFIETSEKYGHTGLLLFESNRGNLEPWTVGQELLSKSRNLIPFVAVNPVYMHPFLAAKKVMTISNLYNRRMFLNFITGTSKSDLSNLNDKLEHDKRYERLVEYIQILDHLLKHNRPLNFNGNYYTVKNLLLSSPLSNDLMPRYFVAGASEAAEKSRIEVKASRASMGKDVVEWQNSKLKPSEGRAVHYGLLARDTREEAIQVMNGWIKNEKDVNVLFELSLKNTDGEWKKRLAAMPEIDGGVFNLSPMKSLRSDCPYYVGSYEECAGVLTKYILNGYDTLITEVASTADEFRHIEKVFKMTEKYLLQRFYKPDKVSFGFNF